MNEKVFRDPVHDYVHVDHPIIYQLINSKEFLSELSTFASTNTGFSAKKGSHDDLISAMLIVTRIIKDISSDDDKLFDIFYNYVEDEIEPMAYCV